MNPETAAAIGGTINGLDALKALLRIARDDVTAYHAEAAEHMQRLPSFATGTAEARHREQLLSEAVTGVEEALDHLIDTTNALEEARS